MLTKKQRKEPGVTAPRLCADLVMAIGNAREFIAEYPDLMIRATDLFPEHKDELLALMAPWAGIKP